MDPAIVFVFDNGIDKGTMGFIQFPCVHNHLSNGVSVVGKKGFGKTRRALGRMTIGNFTRIKNLGNRVRRPNANVLDPGFFLDTLDYF